MLRVDSSNKALTSLGQQAELRARSFFERYSLLEFLANSPRAIFAEAGVELLAAAGGDLPFAVDPDGRVYVIASQEGGRRPDLSKSLELASRIATFSPSEVLNRIDLVDREALSGFLRVPFGELNRTQGVVLVADTFDEGALQTILWLQGRYGLHVSCISLSLLVDSDNREYLLGQVATLEALSNPPARWLLVDVDPPSAVAPVTAEPVAQAARESAEEQVTPREEAPEWRRDFAAVFEEPEVEEELGSFPTVDVVPTSEQSSVGDSLASLFEEPQPADDKPLEANDDERRTSPRSPDYHARRLRLDYQGRLLGARLVDFSEVGLGVEVLSPLPIGTKVAVSGEVSGDDGVYSISGTVTVAHCLSRQDGVCRIGFSLEEATIEKLSSPPEDFDRR